MRTTATTNTSTALDLDAPTPLARQTVPDGPVPYISESQMARTFKDAINEKIELDDTQLRQLLQPEHAHLLHEKPWFWHTDTYRGHMPGWFLQGALDYLATAPGDDSDMYGSALAMLGKRIHGRIPWRENQIERAGWYAEDDEIAALDMSALHQNVRAAVETAIANGAEGGHPDGRHATKMLNALRCFKYDPDRDSEFGDWLMQHAAAPQPGSPGNPEFSNWISSSAADWVSGGHARNGTVWAWQDNPNAVALAEHPDDDVRREFVGALIAPAVSDGRLGVDTASPWHGRNEPGGFGEAYKRMYNDPDDNIREMLHARRDELRRAEWGATRYRDRRRPPVPSMPWGTPVSEPNGTWTDADIALLLDPARRYETRSQPSVDDARANGVPVDRLPDNVVAAGLSEQSPWTNGQIRDMCRAGWIDPTQHIAALIGYHRYQVRWSTYTDHPEAVTREIAVRGCSDSDDRVRLAALQWLSTHPDAVPQGRAAPAAVSVLQYDPDPAIAQRAREHLEHNYAGKNNPAPDDAMLAPYVGTDMWHNNPAMRRAAAAVSNNPELLKQLASDERAAVVEPLLERNNVPTAALLALVNHQQPRIRAAALERLGRH